MVSTTLLHRASSWKIFSQPGNRKIVKREHSSLRFNEQVIGTDLVQQLSFRDYGWRSLFSILMGDHCQKSGAPRAELPVGLLANRLLKPTILHIVEQFFAISRPMTSVRTINSRYFCPTEFSFFPSKNFTV